MKSKIFILFLFAFSNQIFSQHEESLMYRYSDQKFVNNQSVVVKRNNNVTLEVEYNPFSSEMEFLIEEEDLHRQSNINANILSLLQQGQELSTTDLNFNINSDFDWQNFKVKGLSMNGLKKEYIQIKNIKSQIEGIIRNKNLSVGEIKAKLEDLNYHQFSNQMNDRENWNFGFNNKIIEYESFLSSINESIDSIKNNSKGLSSEVNVKNEMTISKLIEKNASDLQLIRNVLLEVNNTPDKFVEIIEVKKDITKVKLRFKNIDYFNGTSSGSYETEKVAIIKAKGGWKINNSAALILNNYNSKSKEYFVDENNIVGADDNDFYIPSIGTTVNFYPYSGRNINFGGLIGASVPLQSDFDGLNFLTGLQGIFGGKNRVSLSSGITYGPIQNLKNGLEIGDTFTGDSNNLTRDTYDLGWFMGLSYNIINLVE